MNENADTKLKRTDAPPAESFSVESLSPYVRDIYERRIAYLRATMYELTTLHTGIKPHDLAGIYARHLRFQQELVRYIQNEIDVHGTDPEGTQLS